MAASRRLVHIASSSGSTNMVLDIEGGRLPTKGRFVSLVLQRESSSRLQSQAWRFTEVRSSSEMYVDDDVIITSLFIRMVDCC